MSETKHYRHWKTETDGEGILWLHLDQADTGANVLCVEVIEELEALLNEHTSKSPPLGIVFVSDKANGFIAGADIKEFTQIPDNDAALRHIRRGQAVMDHIEALPCPTLALIHGFCMGGGLELALACTYRIADDGPKTRLGLPEVQLGIHPGFGGTVRLTRLIGAPSAMDVMLTGRTLNSRSAKKMGVIDYAVPTRQLKSAARSVIMERPAPHKPGRIQKLTNNRLVRPFLAGAMRKKVAQKARKDHYPAPYALIDLWEKYVDHPHTMLVEEAKSVANLVIGETARNLVRVFFLREQLKALGKPKDKGALPEIKRVHVVGAGVMGGDIAAWCALRGLRVTLQDRHPETIAKALKRGYALFKKRLKDDRLARAALDRLIPDIDGHGIAKADIVIEAIVENVEAKQALFRDLETKIKDEALLTTNTSSIPLEMIGEALARPERLVGLHFFNPVAMMPLVEIVHAPATDPNAVNRAASFARQIDRLPLPVVSSPGFLVNRILMPYLLEAVVLHQEGVPAKAIDKAALDFGMPMGPLRLADTVGLDICLSVAEILSKRLDVPVPERLKAMVANGQLGAKSGHGFYRYQDGKPEKDTATSESGALPKDLADRLIGRMVNEAVACLREGVVENEALLDAGVIFGTGFAPFRGGPLHYAETRGVQSFVETLSDLEQRHGEGFKPDAGWAAFTG